MFCVLEPFSPQDHLKKGNFGHLINLSPTCGKSKKTDLCGQKGSIQWKDAKDVLVKQKQLGELPQSPSCPQLSPEHSHSRQKRAGLPQVSSRIARACLRRTFGALVVVSSENPGAHTTPTSIPQASAAVSVPILDLLCHLLVLHICMCKILAGLRRTWLGAHLLAPPSITRCCKTSSAVCCVAVCASSSPSSCPQLHLHHGQGRQTLWKKCCNAEKGPRGGRESQPRNKTQEDGRREL